MQKLSNKLPLWSWQRLPHWMLDGQHFIWYRNVRESRNYHDAVWVHAITIGKKMFTWETR